MKKTLMTILTLLLAAVIAFTAACAEDDDDELTMNAILNGIVDPNAPDDGSTEADLVPGGDDVLVETVEEEGSIYEADGSVLVTITATGDFTIGGDSRKSTDIFANELKKQGGDINFTMKNVKDILEADDLTIVNFEGTLTESKYVPSNKKNNQFLFSAPPSYVSVLSDNGVEAASLENNHVLDHGEDVYAETQQTLENAGIVWSNSVTPGIIDVKGVQICMLSYLCIDRYESLWDKVPADIAAAKRQYDLVIVSFHWGNEKDYAPTNNQIKMGHIAVDAGADLVLGHHSHRINPIVQYKGVYICYSLGNFCFSGNSNPSDMTSYLFQTRFRLRGGELTNEGFRIIPIRISSKKDRNDFIPTPLEIGTATDSLLKVLRSNGRNLEGAVDEYPFEW